MKNKVVKLHNGKDYYIIEELEYFGHLYALAAECDLEKDTINESELFLMEVRMEKDRLIAEEGPDEIRAGEVIKEFQKKMQENS